jgi:DNA-binding NarL/FixJ family response regulator
VIRVLIADDQPLMRAGLRLIFDPEPDIEVVADAGNGAEAVRLCQTLRPQVAIFDIRMPVLDGIQATSQVAGREGTRVLVLTTFDDDDYVYRALRAGASGFLLKDAPPEQIVAGVRTVAAGEALLAPAITRSLIAQYTARSRPDPDRPAPWAELTERELVVLRLMALGLANSEIAERLHLGASTVKTHVGHILMKLDLRDRVQAVVLAYQAGLLGDGDPEQPTSSRRA